MEIQEEEDGKPLSASFPAVAVAVNGSVNSKRAVQWALGKFVPEGMACFRILYVRPKITLVPTPMGNYIPISNVRDDVASAYKREVEWKTTSMLLAYKQLFSGRKVKMDSIVIEADDVADALSSEIAKLKISKLVVGASSQNIFTRKFKEKNLSSQIARCSPSFCTVYVVSKGKLASIHAAKSVVNDERNDEDINPVIQGMPSLLTHQESLIVDNAADNSTSSLELIDINLELQRFRIEQKNHSMFEVVQDESIDASDVVGTCMKEEDEAKAEELTMLEMKRCEAAEREVEHIIGSVSNEDAEGSVNRASYENQRFEKLFASDVESYKKYTWEQIKSATSSFSDTLKIGMGANGTVYKGIFHDTLAAVKVLHSNENHTKKQLERELDILGRIYHPHLLLLIGACPENGCLLYEYMENGSLDDRLQCKDNTPPLPWFHRFRIAWEVASALSFLHNSKPEPIIHRDLKPANILLDCKFISKIGDVGLSTLFPSDSSLMSSIYKNTAPVGTICYIDPEYQRTGQVSPKSDIYALGIVILQLLTGKPPIGLAHIIESALEEGSLYDLLDPRAGDWPEIATRELAQLGISCSEIRRKDRPGLEDQILPVLERLRRRADEGKSLASSLAPIPPSHFICPVLQEVMEDPCVASDGYTYDRKAIETWFDQNETSPMTNLPLPNMNLIPNHSLRSAILEWKSTSK